jgi:hypothetical protein
MGFIFRRVCSTLHTLNFSNKYSHVILGFYDCLLLKMSFHHNVLVFFHVIIITMLDFVFVCLSLEVYKEIFREISLEMHMELCLLLKMSFHHNFLVFFHLIITLLDFVFVCLRFIMKYSERHEATCNLVVLIII